MEHHINKKIKSLTIVTSILIAVIILQIYGFAYLYFKQKSMICDIGDGFYAERQYVYPILRDLGYDPDGYGKEYLNPITTEALGGCNLNNAWRF